MCSTQGHASEVVVDALGVAVTIRADPVLAARLRHQWSRALTDRAGETTVDVIGLDPDDDLGLDYALTSRVTIAALTQTAGQRLNIHAGAVADASGRALAVVGASGSGKTTAICRLAQKLGYLSDETVSVDDDLLIHPHPKPLSVIQDRDSPYRKASLSPDDLGLVEPPDTAHLHRIVILRRGTGGEGLDPLPTPQAIVEIVAQTSSLVLLDEPIRRLADTVDACGGAWVLHYAEIEDWVGSLVDLLDRDPRDPLPRTHHPYVAGSAITVPPGTWSRAPWRDCVQFDDDVVLMVEDTAHVLTGLGGLIWLALAAPQTTDALVLHAQAALGEHPDAPALISQALDELVERRLLVPRG